MNLNKKIVFLMFSFLMVISGMSYAESKPTGVTYFSHDAFRNNFESNDRSPSIAISATEIEDDKFCIRINKNVSASLDSWEKHRLQSNNAFSRKQIDELVASGNYFSMTRTGAILGGGVGGTVSSFFLLTNKITTVGYFKYLGVSSLIGILLFDGMQLLNRVDIRHKLLDKSKLNGLDPMFMNMLLDRLSRVEGIYKNQCSD